jgi:hypothetical protein
MIHGEPSGLTALRDAIVAQHRWPNVTIPNYLQSFDLA